MGHVHLPRAPSTKLLNCTTRRMHIGASCPVPHCSLQFCIRRLYHHHTFYLQKRSTRILQQNLPK